MYVTLNIGTSSIRLLSVKNGKVDKWGKVPLARGLVRDGLILQPEAVGEAISDLFKSTNVPRQPVIVSLTGISFTYRIMSLPRMKPALLREAIPRAARKEMPLPLEELYLSWQAIGSAQDNLDFLILGVPQHPIDTMVQTLAKAGVKPLLVDLNPLALARAANRADAIIVDLEPDIIDIVLVAGGVPMVMHTVTPRGEGASLEDNIEQATNELSKTVKFYNNSHPENPLSLTTPLLLTGELSSDATAGELMQEDIVYPVESLVPPIQFPTDLILASYTSNMGLALSKVPPQKGAKGDAVQLHNVNLNILSSKYQSRSKPLDARNMLVATAFAIIIALLFPLNQLNSQAGAMTAQLQNRLNTVSQELQATRHTTDEAKQIEDTISKIVADTDTMQEDHQRILGNKGDVTSNLELVANALPNGASFTHIDIGPEEITVKGEVNNAFTVISYINSLEKDGDFPEVRIAEISEAAGNIVPFTIVIYRPSN